MDRNQDSQSDKLEERILLIRRVSKKTTGGNYVTFAALVAVGDGKGQVGIGIGRGLEVPPAIQKAITKAKKNMVTVPIYRASIPHSILFKYKAAKILLKPAPEGTGLKVGGVARVILNLAGVYNASGKVIGSRNQVVNTYAVIEAIKRLKKRVDTGKVTVAKEPEKMEKKDEVPAPIKQVVNKAKVKKEVKKEVKVKKAVVKKKKTS
jgi:small subunit ribosomal protein S5